MSLELLSHPLASYCQKVLVALYDNDTPFVARLIDLQDEAVRAEFRKLSPMGKMPVLVDSKRERTVLESTIVVEYLARYYPGKTALIPEDPELAWRTRHADRFYDLYVQGPMQQIIGDRLRPEGSRDPYGVEQARAQLEVSYGVIEGEMKSRTWATGEAFGMGDCSAAPALYYADFVAPIGDRYPAVRDYLARLKARPSFARVLEEAKPYLANVPK